MSNTYDYFDVAFATIMRGGFHRTSENYRWRGKIRCNYCKSEGYGGSIITNPSWWGQHHGENCRKKGL